MEDIEIVNTTTKKSVEEKDVDEKQVDYIS